MAELETMQAIRKSDGLEIRINVTDFDPEIYEEPRVKKSSTRRKKTVVNSESSENGDE